MDKLEFFLAIFVTILLIVWRFGRGAFIFKSARKVDTIPSIHWAGFKFPLIDGFIGLYKLRTQGLDFFASYVASGLKFAKCGLGPETIYFAADPDVIQKVLKSTNSEHLNKPAYIYKLFSSLLKDGLLANNVSTWMPHRKAAELAFTHRSLGIYLQYTNHNAKDLVHKACSQVALFGNGSIENAQVSKLLSHSLFQLTTQIIMGSEHTKYSDHENRIFHDNFRKGKDITVERYLNPLLQVPPIWWLHPKRRQLNATMEYGRNISVQVIKKYRANSQSSKLNYSVDSDSEVSGTQSTAGTTTTIKSATENEDFVMGVKPFGCVVEQLIASGLSDQEIIDEVATFLAAGHETVNVALNMLIFYLASHPDIQKKCQGEIDQLFVGDDLDARDLTMNDLSSLKYLKQCIFESMRLTPPVPGYARELGAPLNISKECTLDTGSVILVSAWGVHRDPAVYPNPHVFDPDRFLAENVRKRHPYSFIPFSMGMRNCIGWKLALMQMKVYLALILHHFNLSTTDGMNDVKILFDITIHPERPYHVTFEKRVF